MNATRVALAAILGGIIMFVWGAVLHMATPLGQAGMDNLPDAALPALRESLAERKIYYFPGMPEHGPDASDAEKEEAMAAWQTAYEAGPRGMVVYEPSGGTPFDPAQLGVEFISGLLAALILAAFLSRLGGGLARGAMAGAAFGVFAWASITVSEWNWYRFPDTYALAALVEQGAGWLLAGAGIGLALRCRRTRAAPSAAAD